MIKIKEKFQHLSVFLQGNPKQFLLQNGDFFCVRDGCEECPYVDTCQSKEEKVSTALIPPARRAIGLEEKPFLILKLLPGKEFRFLNKDEVNDNVFPESLWNTPRDVYSLDERNIHFILSDLNHPFRVMKGQCRFYGTREVFQQSEYSKYFEVYQEYTPSHHIVAMDFSAIEPRGSAIQTQEPNWLKIYEGTPKVIVREIETTETNQFPEYIYPYNGKFFCFLNGELDKSTYERQCKGCKLNSNCKIIREFKKNVPGDFHSLNAKAFFSNDPKYPTLGDGSLPTPEQSYVLKEFRNISKICGLAAVYGAQAFTLAGHMKCSEEEAQKRLDNFFALLTKARKSMLHTEQNILTKGISKNFFGRVWDLRRFTQGEYSTDKERRQKIAYAVRIGYNHPIQSSMSEALKIAMVRVDDYLQEQKWSPLSGQSIPLSCSDISYLDFICCVLLSIHDEMDSLVRSDMFDTVLPPIYRVAQIRDVIKSLGVNFLLEMDVEYDETRSFTASQQYPNAKIHLLNTVLPRLEKLKEEPNTYVTPLEQITKEVLEKLSQIKSSEGVELWVKADEKYFVYPHKIPEKKIKELGIEHTTHYLYQE